MRGGAEAELATLTVQRENWESRNYLFVGNNSLAYSDELNNSIANLQSQLNTAKIDLNTKIDNNINSLSSQINTINNSITNLQTKVATSSSTYTTDYVDMDSCATNESYHQIIIEERTIKLANGQEQKIKIPYIMSNIEKDRCIGFAAKLYSGSGRHTTWEWCSSLDPDAS